VDSGKLVREFRTVPLRVPPAGAARVWGAIAAPYGEGSMIAPAVVMAYQAGKRFDRGHEEPVFSVAFSPDGKQLATGSGGLERVIKIWNVEDGALLRDLNNATLKRAPLAQGSQSHPGWVYGLRWTKDGKRIVSVGDAPLNKGYLAVWDAAAGKLLHGEELPLGSFFSVALAPDGQHLLIGAGPRGRPTPEFNSAYLMKMPEAGK
jgi:WD40 repeat protein